MNCGENIIWVVLVLKIKSSSYVPPFKTKGPLGRGFNRWRFVASQTYCFFVPNLSDYLHCLRVSILNITTALLNKFFIFIGSLS